MSLYSIKMEKYVLGGLLKNPDVVAELDAFLSVGDFFNEVHQSIYSVIRNLYIAGEHVDKVIVSERIINIGITAKDEISRRSQLAPCEDPQSEEENSK